MNSSNIKSFSLEYWKLTWYLLIAILGITGNGVVMIVVLLSKNINRTSSFHIAIFSLAFADFMASLFSLPTFIMSTDIFQNYHPKNISGDLMCIFITGYSLPYWFIGALVFILVFISIERWNAILYKKCLLFQQKSAKFKIATMVLIFFLALITESLCAAFLVYDPNNKQFGNFCKYFLDKTSDKIILTLVIYILDTAVPVDIVSYCFYQISFFLQTSGVFLANSMKVSKVDIILIRKVKTIKTIKILGVAFCICILPNRILLVLSSLKEEHVKWNNWISQVFVLMRLSNSFINPLIFCFQSKQFRTNLSMVFYRLYKRKSITSSRGKQQSNGYEKLQNMTF
ncbi:high-affinity lysophosphatidic acid receptor-like [Hydra vulgaris]|uniref:High-affinity lysophosphatidic acid receptor-like n=1 Tax=Hydra vulgaris TaxID=6087 RepID=A0ABM4DKB5_HYDVU